MELNLPFCFSLNDLKSLHSATMRLLRSSSLKQKFCAKFRILFNPESLGVVRLWR